MGGIGQVASIVWNFAVSKIVGNMGGGNVEIAGNTEEITVVVVVVELVIVDCKEGAEGKIIVGTTVGVVGGVGVFLLVETGSTIGFEGLAGAGTAGGLAGFGAVGSGVLPKTDGLSPKAAGLAPKTEGWPKMDFDASVVEGATGGPSKMDLLLAPGIGSSCLGSSFLGGTLGFSSLGFSGITFGASE